MASCRETMSAWLFITMSKPSTRSVRPASRRRRHHGARRQCAAHRERIIGRARASKIRISSLFIFSEEMKVCIAISVSACVRNVDEIAASRSRFAVAVAVVEAVARRVRPAGRALQLAACNINHQHLLSICENHQHVHNGIISSLLASWPLIK